MAQGFGIMLNSARDCFESCKGIQIRKGITDSLNLTMHNRVPKIRWATALQSLAPIGDTEQADQYLQSYYKIKSSWVWCGFVLKRTVALQGQIWGTLICLKYMSLCIELMKDFIKCIVCKLCMYKRVLTQCPNGDNLTEGARAQLVLGKNAELVTSGSLQTCHQQGGFGCWHRDWRPFMLASHSWLYPDTERDQILSWVTTINSAYTVHFW